MLPPTCVSVLGTHAAACRPNARGSSGGWSHGMSAAHLLIAAASGLPESESLNRTAAEASTAGDGAGSGRGGHITGNQFSAGAEGAHGSNGAPTVGGMTQWEAGHGREAAVAAEDPASTSAEDEGGGMGLRLEDLLHNSGDSPPLLEVLLHKSGDSPPLLEDLLHNSGDFTAPSAVPAVPAAALLAMQSGAAVRIGTVRGVCHTWRVSGGKERACVSWAVLKLGGVWCSRRHAGGGLGGGRRGQCSRAGRRQAAVGGRLRRGGGHGRREGLCRQDWQAVSAPPAACLPPA